jgi:hypothetical protein
MADSELAPQPHPDAIFDPMYRSRHGGNTRMDGWRFELRCTECGLTGGSMPATRDPDSHQEKCPECGAPAEVIRASERE